MVFRGDDPEAGSPVQDADQVEHQHGEDQEPRALDVKDVHLVDGRMRAVCAEATRVKGLTARSVEFAGCELGDLRWTGESCQGPGSTASSCWLPGSRA